MEDEVQKLQRRANLIASLFRQWPKEWPPLDLKLAQALLAQAEAEFEKWKAEQREREVEQ
jgi:hypothetical protein